MHITFLSLFPMKSVVRTLKFEYSTETNETGTVVFLVRFRICFLYPPLLHIELSNDVPQSPDRFLLPKSVLQKFFFRALKFEYSTETNETGTVVFLVRFQISFLYPPLLHIELITGGWQYLHNTFLSLLWTQLVFVRYFSKTG